MAFPGYLRLSQGHVFLLPGMVDCEAGAPHFSALELAGFCG